MAKEDIVLVFENIGGVDEDIHMLSENLQQLTCQM
jgi:hypothetical protein